MLTKDMQVMIGGVGVTIVNWYCLRAANLKKDRLLPEEIEGKYTEQQLSEMGEYSPYFRYAIFISPKLITMLNFNLGIFFRLGVLFLCGC